MHGNYSFQYNSCTCTNTCLLFLIIYRTITFLSPFSVSRPICSYLYDRSIQVNKFLHRVGMEEVEAVLGDVEVPVEAVLEDMEVPVEAEKG